MITRYSYKPEIYFILTFVVTYLLWSVGAFFSFQVEKSGISLLLMLFGLMTPFLISLAMILISGNPGLRKDFVKRLIDPRLINTGILPVFLLIMPVAVLLSILISIPLGGAVSQFHFAEGFSFSSGALPVLLLLLLAAIFEELGWRGYAFDSLLSRFNYFKASLVFGILWSLWHLPLIFVNDSYQYKIFHENIWFGVNFFLSIIPMGIIISWICIKNRKSIGAAIIFHFIINISQEMFAITQVTKCIETVVLSIFAGMIIILDREMFFSREHLAEYVE